MRIEVINTGTELLLGKVVNTHIGYFGDTLFPLGLRVQRQTTIPDGEEIKAVLEEAFDRTDVILVTGGLGPTSDDVTREVVADLLNRELILDEGVLEHIRQIFSRLRVSMTDSNRRQAMVPEGAKVLVNPNGTAPGLYLPADKGAGFPHVFLMPGPPRELKPMWESQVLPKIESLLPASHAAGVIQNFRLYGIGESTLESQLEPQLVGFEDLEIGYCARLGEVDLRLIGDEEVVAQASEVVRAAYEKQIVSEDEESIAAVLIRLLSEKNETVATAESCTGGAIASCITDESGSSAIFHRGYVTYSNEAKEALLGVPMEVLERNGAVSEPVVRAMATGCLHRSGADHAVAVTGIAGPTGGTDEKPVGTVWVSVASRGGEIYSKKYTLSTDRISFKLRVTRVVLDLLRRRVAGFEF